MEGNNHPLLFVYFNSSTTAWKLFSHFYLLAPLFPSPPPTPISFSLLRDLCDLKCVCTLLFLNTGNARERSITCPKITTWHFSQHHTIRLLKSKTLSILKPAEWRQIMSDRVRLDHYCFPHCKQTTTFMEISFIHACALLGLSVLDDWQLYV